MILDPHSQKYISHDLINDISYQNASAVTSVVQHLWCNIFNYCDIFYQKYKFLKS